MKKIFFILSFLCLSLAGTSQEDKKKPEALRASPVPTSAESPIKEMQTPELKRVEQGTANPKKAVEVDNSQPELLPFKKKDDQ